VRRQLVGAFPQPCSDTTWLCGAWQTLGEWFERMMCKDSSVMGAVSKAPSGFIPLLTKMTSGLGGVVLDSEALE